MASTDKKRKVIGAEGRAIISQMYHFLKDEYEFMRNHNTDKCDLTPLANVRKRTADAAGVSDTTVTRVLREEKHLPSTSKQFTNPMKKRRRRDGKTDVDHLSANAIRTTVHNYQEVNKQAPSIQKLKPIFEEIFGFDGCRNTLKNMLIKMGYKWTSGENNKKVMTERLAVQLWRYRYLKNMLQYRTENRPIVYTGVTLTLKTKGKGMCFAVLHAGTKDGFISKAFFIHKANVNSENDYSISYEVYNKWLNDKLLPNLPENAVVVVDDAPYNNRTITVSTQKEDLQKLLNKHHIPYDENAHRIELYDILRKNKDTCFTFETDDLIRSKGFTVLRVPPKHPELNVIESVFKVVNTNVNFMNIDKKFKEDTAAGTWTQSSNIVQGIEKEYFKYYDANLELAINVHSEDESEEEFSDSSLSDDDDE